MVDLGRKEGVQSPLVVEAGHLPHARRSREDPGKKVGHLDGTLVPLGCKAPAGKVLQKLHTHHKYIVTRRPQDTLTMSRDINRTNFTSAL